MVHRIELQVNEPPGGPGFSVTLAGPGDECVLGRSPDCGVRIDDDMAADRHCRLYLAGDELMVENLDEEIGTCLNGEFVADPMSVRSGSELLVGATVFRVDVSIEADEEVSGGPADQEAAEEAPAPGPVEQPEKQAEPPAIAERPIEPEPLPPFEPPTAPAGGAPDRSESGASEGRSWAHAMTYSADTDLVSRIMSDLCEEFPEQAGSRNPDALRSLVERGIERAKGYGLEEDDHVYQFLRCMVMLDDEIDGRNPDTEDVWLTLNHARRPAAQRIERAVKIASRIWGEKSGSRSRGMMRAPRTSARTPAPVEPAQAPVVQSPAAAPVQASAEELTAGGTNATRGTPPPPPDAAVPEALPEIEGFSIKEEIGAGGMGRVFLAYDNQLDKDVAIKVLRSVDPEAQEQLQHEARAAARLEHPNIVQVARFEKMGRGGFYVMQFVRGMDGAKLVKKFESSGAHQLPGDEVLRVAGVDAKRSAAELRELLTPDKNAYYRLVAYWIAGVADGLERAHAEGVLHRDIKPSNLLLSGDGRMMITDFGLAARPADRQGMSRARVGTPRYLSPERVADWASFSDEVQHRDARADVWSLGAVLYEFLTYRPAFKGTVPEVLRAIVTEDPASPSSLVWSVPEGLEKICLKAMARRPDDRFARASEMAEALRGWVRVETGADKRGRIPFLS